MQPYLAMITPLTGNHPDQGLPPGQGGYPSQPIYHPGHPDHGLPPYPDQGLPGGGHGQGGRPSQPIYHPGHPDHGLPAYPDQGLPAGGQGGRPTHPIHIPGVPDQGLPEPEPIPPGVVPPIALPPEYTEDLVIGVKPAGSNEWKFNSYDTSVGIDNKPPQPAPTPHAGTHAPQSRR